MRDVPSVLSFSTLPSRILRAAFNQTDQSPLIDEILQHSSTESSCVLVNNLSPHERAVLLVQCLSEIVLFLHKLADSQWPHRENFSLSLPPLTLTEKSVERTLAEFGEGRERITVLETVEGSRVFTECALAQQIADLVTEAVEIAEHDGYLAKDGHGAVEYAMGGMGGQNSGRYYLGGGGGGERSTHGHHGHGHGHPRQRRSVVVVDDSELQEISLSFVNDKGPDDMVLPCGMKILPLN